MRERSLLRWTFLLIATYVSAAAAYAQPSGRRDYRPGSRPSFDLKTAIKRMDRNHDGYIRHDEIPEQLRPIVDRLAREARLDPHHPISVKKLTHAIDDKRRKMSGRGPSRDRANTNDSESLVPGFGEDGELPTVAGFGDTDGQPTTTAALKTRYESKVLEYVNRIYYRYDSNKNDVLDQEEWKNIQWQSDPKQSDTNGDGRLTKAEFCERMVARWKWGRKTPAPTGNKTTSSGSFDSSKTASDSSGSADNEKVRRYAKSLLKQYDVNKNGVLEKDEWSKMRGDPKAGDSNGDGVLTLDELTAKLSSYGKSSGSSTSSGSSKKQGSRYASTRTSSPHGSSYRSDSDKPSYRFKTPAERLPAGLPDWFSRNDADGDGQIKMSEYSTSWTKTKAQEFKEYDLNGDGIITPQEYLDSQAEED
jgi:Ca2+-binding EF-hand superfamily protein